MILPTLEDVRAAATRIAPYVYRTPLLRNDVLDARVGGEVY
jgi:threonine dehydratase